MAEDVLSMQFKAEAAEAFATFRELKKQLLDITKNRTGDIRFRLNTTETKANARKLNSDLAAILKRQVVKVSVDGAQARTQATALNRAIAARLKAQTVKVRLDPARARAQLTALNKEIATRLRHRVIKVSLDASRARLDATSLNAALAGRLRAVTITVRLAAGRVIADATALAARLAVILKDHTINVNLDTGAATAQLAVFAGLMHSLLRNHTVRVGVNVNTRAAVTGLASVNSWFGKTLRGAGGLTGGLRGLGGAFLLLVTTAPFVITTMNALVGGFFALGGAIAPAAGLLATLPGLFGAAAAGGAALFFGLKGVMGALKEGAQADKAAVTATQQNVAATRDLTSAKRSVADAQRALNDIVAAYPANVDDARLDRRETILAELDAVDRLAAAQKTLADLQRGLGKATYEATTQLDQFTGKQVLTYTQTIDAAKSEMTRKEALRAVQTAQVELARATTTRQRAEQSLAGLTRNGVKGTREYRDALRSLTRSQQDLAKQSKATTTELVKAPAAVDQYQAALADLTPEGRSFVQFLRGEWLPAFGESRKGIERNLAPPVEDGMRRMIPTMRRGMGFLATLAGDIGGAFRSAGTALATPEWQARLTGMFAVIRPVVGDFLRIVGAGARGVSDLIITAGDLTQKVSGGLAGATERWANNMEKATQKGSSLRGFFDRAWSAASRTWTVVKNLTGTIVNLGSVGRRAIGDDLLDNLVTLTGEWEKNTSSARGVRKISGWFKEMKQPFKTVVGLVRDLVTWWTEFGASKNFESQVTSIRGIGTAIGDIIKKFDESNVLGHLLTAFALVAGALADITNAWGVWGLVAVIAVRRIVVAMLAQLGAAIGRMIVSFAVMAAKHLAAMLRMAAQWLIGLGPIGLIVAAVIAAVVLIVKHWDKIAKAAKWVWEKIRNGIDWLIGWVKKNWPLMLAILTGPIGLAVLAIVKHKDRIVGAIRGAIDWVQNNWKTLLAILTGPFGLAVGLIAKNWDKIKAGVRAFHGWVTEKIESIGGVFGRIGEAIDAVSFEALKDAFFDVVQSIIDMWNSVDFSITLDPPKWAKKLGFGTWKSPDLFPDIANLPGRRFGGDVKAGTAYEVNEDARFGNREIFVPDQDGRIEPSMDAFLASINGGGRNGSPGSAMTEAQLRRLEAAAASNRQVIVQAEISKDTDPMVQAREIGWALR